jgi:hypothetical protein
MECVAACPAKGALDLAVISPSRGRISPWAMAAGIAVLFLGIVGFAKASGHWNGDVPGSVYRRLVPQAEDVNPPMP